MMQVPFYGGWRRVSFIGNMIEQAVELVAFLATGIGEVVTGTASKINATRRDMKRRYPLIAESAFFY